MSKILKENMKQIESLLKQQESQNAIIKSKDFEE